MTISITDLLVYVNDAGWVSHKTLVYDLINADGSIDRVKRIWYRNFRNFERPKCGERLPPFFECLHVKPAPRYIAFNRLNKFIHHFEANVKGNWQYGTKLRGEGGAVISKDRIQESPNFVTSTQLLSVTQSIQAQLGTLVTKINDLTQRFNAASAENQVLRKGLQSVKDGLIKLSQDQKSQLETLSKIQATQKMTQRDLADLTARVVSVNAGILKLLDSIGL